MRNLSTYLLVIFMVMFWIFRIMVTFMYELGSDFAGIIPLNKTLEIVLLFVVLLCIILIAKRKMIGALIYLLSYGLYFGTDLTTKLTAIFEDMTQEITMGTSLSMFVSLIGVALPLAVLIDLLLDKQRKANPKDKKTDWFYKNEAFDRKLDDRADKNNYRTM